MRETQMRAIMYAVGSLLPLSTSKREAVLYLRFSLLERRIEKTDAASVDAMTEPKRKLMSHSTPRTK